MKKYEIQCPHCNGTFFETNEKFKEDAPANGSMFTASKHIIDAGWSFMPLYDTTEYADVVCPSCDGQLLNSAGMVLRLKCVGKIEEVEAVQSSEDVAEKIPCPVCGKGFKQAGLPMHIKHKHPEYEG
jgi:DNA-directed RNA polymerase subunit RPC12/RpoP